MAEALGQLLSSPVNYSPPLTAVFQRPGAGQARSRQAERPDCARVTGKAPANYFPECFVTMKLFRANPREIQLAVSHRTRFLGRRWLKQLQTSPSLQYHMSPCRGAFSSRINVPGVPSERPLEKKKKPKKQQTVLTQTWDAARHILVFEHGGRRPRNQT